MIKKPLSKSVKNAAKEEKERKREFIPKLVKDSIIKARFDSDNNVVATYARLGRLFGLKERTIRSIVKTYEERGNNERKPILNRSKKLNDWQIKMLVNDNILRQHASLTLVERCKWIKDNWRVSITPATLSKYYRSSGI